MSLQVAKYPQQVWNGLSFNNKRTDSNRDIGPDFRDWDQMSSEVIAMQTEMFIDAQDRAISTFQLKNSHANLQKSILTFSKLNVPITGDSIGFGTVPILTFPGGPIGFLGATASLHIEKVGTGILDNTGFYVLVGTTVQDIDHTGPTTDNIIREPSPVVLTDGKVDVAGRGLFPSVFDGTDSPISANLNLLSLSTPVDGDAVLITGTLAITWVKL